MAASETCENLRRSFEVVRALAENSDDLALLLGSDGVILDLNRRMAERLGQAPAQLKGKVIWPLLPASSRAILQPNIQRALTEERTLHFEDRNDAKWYGVSCAPCSDDGGQVAGVAILAWDITAHKETQIALERWANATEGLHDALQAISAAPDMDAALAQLIKKAMDLGRMDAGVAYLMEGEGAVCRRQEGLAADFVEQVSGFLSNTAFVNAARETPREAWEVGNRFPEQSRLFEAHGLHHVYCISLEAKKTAFGYLVLFSRQARPPIASSLELITLLALKTGFAFVRLVAEERLQSVLAATSMGVSATLKSLSLLQELELAPEVETHLKDILVVNQRTAELITRAVGFSGNPLLQSRPSAPWKAG